MRKPQGYVTIVDPGANTVELDTFTCFHCQKIVSVKPGFAPEDIGGLCKQCMQLVCPLCVANGFCTPWEKTMEKIEARDRFRRSAGLEG